MKPLDVKRQLERLPAGAGRRKRDAAVPAEFFHTDFSRVVSLGDSALDAIEGFPRRIAVWLPGNLREQRRRLRCRQRFPRYAMRFASFTLEGPKCLREALLRVGRFDGEEAVEEFRHLDGARAGDDLLGQNRQRVEAMAIEKEEL